DRLRRLLADSRNGLEKLRVLADDGSLQLAWRVARHDRESNLRSDSTDREELLEELALAGVREAVELERVVANVQMGLEDHLVRSFGLEHRAGRREEAVADSGDIDD